MTDLERSISGIAIARLEFSTARRHRLCELTTIAVGDVACPTSRAACPGAHLPSITDLEAARRAQAALCPRTATSSRRGLVLLLTFFDPDDMRYVYSAGGDPSGDA